MSPLIIALAAAVSPSATTAPNAVVEQYYRAIGRHDYHAAYLCWDQAGAASHKSFPVFARGFANTTTVRAVVGRPKDIEGAAGSFYTTVPVEIRSTLVGGRQQTFVGSYTLRRESEATGTWHLYAASLTARATGG